MAATRSGAGGVAINPLGGWEAAHFTGILTPDLPTIRIEEPAMTAETITKLEQRKAAITPRQFVLPVVRPLSMATAHPAPEVWTTPAAKVRPIGRPQVLPARGRNLRSSSFAELQERMPAVVAAERERRQRAVVVVPSRTVDKWQEPAAETQAYEERLLCSLLDLRDRALRMTYVTSSPINPAIIDYYLSLLPPRLRRDARSRLTLVTLGERTSRPLSKKLLDRRDVLERIRRSIVDPSTAHLVPYTTTSLEQDVALELGIPMYGADPCHAYLGTKTGCRELFAQAGVPHPLGIEGIKGVTEAVAGIVRLRAERPGLSRLVIKLNDGVSGEGNALVDLAGLPTPGSAHELQEIFTRVRALVPEAPGVSAPQFLAKLAKGGGIVEEWITGRELRSPSVQLQITPLGEAQLLSTHDQILGGPSGQSYLGCRFPAEASHAPIISALARRVADQLADAGVIGRFAVDFVVVRAQDGSWKPFAIELNLRKGGTTHPYETLAHLTGGTYDPDTGTFTTPTGQCKHYVATDHLEAPELRQLGCQGLLALVRRGALKFDPMQRIGPVFHMLSSLDELGRTGLTAIGNSAEQASAIYEDVKATLMENAGIAAERVGAAAAAA